MYSPRSARRSAAAAAICAVAALLAVAAATPVSASDLPTVVLTPSTVTDGGTTTITGQGWPVDQTWSAIECVDYAGPSICVPLNDFAGRPVGGAVASDGSIGPADAVV